MDSIILQQLTIPLDDTISIDAPQIFVNPCSHILWILIIHVGPQTNINKIGNIQMWEAAISHSDENTLERWYVQQDKKWNRTIKYHMNKQTHHYSTKPLTRILGHQKDTSDNQFCHTLGISIVKSSIGLSPTIHTSKKLLHILIIPRTIKYTKSTPVRQNTVEPVLSDHPFYPAKAVAQDRWSLITGRTKIMFYRSSDYSDIYVVVFLQTDSMWDRYDTSIIINNMLERGGAGDLSP